MTEVENLVLEELRAIRKEIAELKDEAATRKQVAALATGHRTYCRGQGRVRGWPRTEAAMSEDGVWKKDGALKCEPVDAPGSRSSA